MKFETDWSLKSFYWPIFQFFYWLMASIGKKLPPVTKQSTGKVAKNITSISSNFYMVVKMYFTILSGTFGTISWERNSSWNATSPFPSIGFFGGWMFWLFWWRPRSGPFNFLPSHTRTIVRRNSKLPNGFAD